MILCILLNTSRKDEKHRKVRQWTYKVVNESAYYTIEIILGTIKCILWPTYKKKLNALHKIIHIYNILHNTVSNRMQWMVQEYRIKCIPWNFLKELNRMLCIWLIIVRNGKHEITCLIEWISRKIVQIAIAAFNVFHPPSFHH